VTVQIFEEHAAVLAHWWEQSRAPRTVVYLDAHLDLQQLSEERLAVLESCKSGDELRELAKPHHLSPDRGYGYGIEDFLQPARRLGLVDHLVWVAPPHVPIALSFEHLEHLEHLEQMDGVTFDELAAFRPDANGILHGRLLDIDLTICRYEELPAVALPTDCAVDVDMDFFVAVPGDRVWLDRPLAISNSPERGWLHVGSRERLGVAAGHPIAGRTDAS
jgi:hypothetical protein